MSPHGFTIIHNCSGETEAGEPVMSKIKCINIAFAKQWQAVGKTYLQSNWDMRRENEVMQDKKGIIKQKNLTMIWKCSKVSVESDESKWGFTETHMEDSSFEDERTITSK